MKMLDKTGVEFLDVLSSNAPVPGGGGASAAVGAFAAALGLMVTNLTIGKKKYADYENEMIACRERLIGVRDRLVRLVDEDAAAFEPLSRAYSLPKDDPNYDTIMEKALVDASVVPLDIMETILDGMHELSLLVEKGSRLAVSDVGVAVLFAQAALEGASLNILINAKSMKNRERAETFKDHVDYLVAEGHDLRYGIYQKTLEAIR